MNLWKEASREDITYLPEGMRWQRAENREAVSSLLGLERAMEEGRILESTVVLCDSDLTLHVDLGPIRGIIPREEALFCRREETVKDIAIITRVGKPVCFKVMGFRRSGGETVALLSRRAAQEECIRIFLSSLLPGDVIPARVTHSEGFGAFVDVGCGVSSLLSVDCISVSRISHPSDRLTVGDILPVIVKAVDRERDRLFVSLKELLGTWEENAERFRVGETVSGIVRSIESYGIFVELSPNLAGLAELREGSAGQHTPRVGETVAVYVKSILPERMKIKLVLIDTYRGDPPREALRLYVDTERIRHVDRWRYSPLSCARTVETVFE